MHRTSVVALLAAIALPVAAVDTAVAKNKPPKAEITKTKRGPKGKKGARGPQGLPGAPGPQGVQGPAGVTGYNIVEGPKIYMCADSGAYQSCQLAESEARCPIGQVVLGGGGFNGVADAGYTLPSGDSAGWKHAATNWTGLSTTFVQAYAVCATVMR